jgi:hypothetical protein
MAKISTMTTIRAVPCSERRHCGESFMGGGAASGGS